MSDELIRVPAFLAEETGDYGIMPMCDFCAEVACESADMECGQACGQSCGSQCTVAECKQSCSQGCSQCGSCESSSQTVYTAPTFTITNITETGCDVNVQPGSGYTRYRVFARLTSDPDDVSYDWIFDKTVAFTAVMNTLLPRTEYAVNVCGVIGNTSDKWAGTKKFTTGGKSRPADWSWWSAVAAGKPVNISADEWNAFYDRIDAFRIYAGQGAWGLYKPVSKGTVISAAIVNEVRAAIGPITTAARPKYINPGDPITADYFNSLKDFLNSVP